MGVAVTTEGEVVMEAVARAVQVPKKTVAAAERATHVVTGETNETGTTPPRHPRGAPPSRTDPSS